MKKTMLVLLILMSLLVGGGGTALAEPLLKDVLDGLDGQMYKGHITHISGTDFTFDKIPKEATVVAYDKAEYAGDTNFIGYCLVSNPTTKIPLSSINNPGDYQSFTPSGTFALYIYDQSTNTYWNTLTSQNSDKTRHVDVYKIDDSVGGGYFLGFEDRTDPNSDWDYQDIVIKLTNVTANVPEFPTVAVPVAAVLGLLFIFGRKKEKL